MNITAKLKNSWKSLTIFFNAVIGGFIVALPDLKGEFTQLQDYLPEHLYKYGMVIIIVGNILLRFKTNKDLAHK